MMMTMRHSHFFQFCIEGKCVPFYPDDVKPIDDNSIDHDTKTMLVSQPKIDTAVLIDGRPAWYDPIFTETFIELRNK